MKPYLVGENTTTNTIYNAAELGTPLFVSQNRRVAVYEGFKTPPITWVADGLVRERGFHIFYGPTGTMKSYSILDMVMRLVNGHGEFNGRTLDPSEVMIVIGEGLPDYRTRIDAWKIVHNADKEPLCILSPTMFDDPEDMQAVEDAIKWFEAQGRKIKLVIFDTLSTMAGKIKIMDNDEVNSKLAAPLLKLSLRTGIATLLVHHTGHEGQHEKGASALRQNCDVSVYISKSGDTVTWEVMKRRHGVEGDKLVFKVRDVSEETGIPFAAVLDGIGGHTAKANKGIREQKSIPEQQDDAIYTIIAAYGEEGVKQAKVVEVAESHGIPQSSAYKSISRLQSRSRIQKVGKLLFADDENFSLRSDGSGKDDSKVA